MLIFRLVFGLLLVSGLLCFAMYVGTAQAVWRHRGIVIVKWAVICAVLGGVANLWFSSGEATGIRICFALMVAGAGAITGALLCANFTADDSDPSIPPH